MGRHKLASSNIRDQETWKRPFSNRKQETNNIKNINHGIRWRLETPSSKRTYRRSLQVTWAKVLATKHDWHGRTRWPQKTSTGTQFWYETRQIQQRRQSRPRRLCNQF